ncbi:MAG: STAS domain-containing protein [Clostridiales bacterium]|nr:STAS domain-containing protein [Clostridiales bacterium]HAW15526.1 anti-sigma factor antagonist [Clostridiales bacterium]
MTIEKKLNGNELIMEIKGRLDTVTASELESSLKQSLAGIETLIFDLKDMEYISSAGLRVLLSTQKIMNARGTMKIINVSETVAEVFEVTGFSDILNIE